MCIHGGDIYRNHIDIDFSISVNPLGMPESVKLALHNAVKFCDKYPDIRAEKLKKAVSKMCDVPEEYLLFGNGASELFMAASHAIKANKTIIPVPTFYGYEYAAMAAGSKVFYYQISRLDNFYLTENINNILTKDVGLIFLANPNNPTGVLLDKETVKSILKHCRDREIYVVLDESFIEFCGSRFSMLSEIEEFDNLILVRTFTKIFSIPGVRLGYLICKNYALLTKIARQLSEWNLSCFAQEAGCACALQTNFVKETETYIKKERCFLEDGLRQKGFLVFPSTANFILIYSDKPLYEKLLEKGILIRDCTNFRGLSKGFYRIAVKGRNENKVLLREIGD